MVKDTPDSNPRSEGPEPTDAGPDIAPHGRETAMQDHRKRREAEPAAAPSETDAESGGASAVADPSDEKTRDDPAQPYLDAERHSPDAHEAHEVRAGPGDAGAQDAPELLPKTPRAPKASLARIVLWFVVPIAVLLALYWAMTG